MEFKNNYNPALFNRETKYSKFDKEQVVEPSGIFSQKNHRNKKKKMRVFSSERPYTAVTEKINQLVSAHDDEFEPEAELPSLLEAIKIQASPGAIEAARALRKKLKYGTPKEQLRSLVILELLVSNGGRALFSFYADTKLLDNLKIIANDSSRNSKVRNKIIMLAVSWRQELSGMKGYENLANLYKQVPIKSKSSRKSRKALTNLNFMDDTADDTTPFETIVSDNEYSSSRTHSSPSQSETRKHRKTFSRSKTHDEYNAEYRIPQIDYLKEKPKILQLIAESSTSSTNLVNSLHNLRKGELSTDNDKASMNFDKCRQIRKKVLRYLQLVSEEEFLGALIHANEQLVSALEKYDKLSQFADNSNSESDYETEEEFENDNVSIQLSTFTLKSSDDQSVLSHLNTNQLSPKSLKSPRNPPPIPSKPKNLHFDNIENDSDPFGDSNAVETSTSRW